jgi:hypothetical protein
MSYRDRLQSAMYGRRAVVGGLDSNDTDLGLASVQRAI